MKEIVISREDFDRLLNEYQYDNVLTQSEKDELYRFSINHNLTYDRLKAIFNGARKYAIITRKDKRFIGPAQLKELIIKMCETQDTRTYEQFDMIDKQLKQYYRDNDLEYPKGFDRIIKALYDKIQSITYQENSEMVSFSDEMYNFIYSFACLYSSLAKYIQSENNEKIKITYRNGEEEFLSMLDYLITKRILSLKSVERLTVKDVLELDGFLQELTAGEGVNKNELFSSKDVFSLFNKTASIIGHVSRDKLREMRSILKEYIAHISKLSEEDKLVDTSKIDAFTTKDMFLTGGSILIRKPVSIQDTVNFLTGAPVREIINSKKRYSENSNIDSLLHNFPNLRLTGMDSAKHFNIIDNNTAIFTTLNLDNLNRVATTYTEILYSTFNLGPDNVPISEKITKLRENGFDIDYLITGDNIVGMFTSEAIADISNKATAHYKNVTNNLRILGSLLDLRDVQKIISYNYNLITIDSAELLENVKRVIAKSGSREKLAENLEELLNMRVPYNYTKNSTGKSQKRLVASLLATMNQDKDKQVEIGATHIDITDVDLDLDRLNGLGIGLPLDLSLGTTPKGGETSDIDKIIIVDNDNSDKLEDKIVDVIDNTQTDYAPTTETSKVVNIHLIYEQLSEIVAELNRFMQERESNKMVALASQIRLKINTLALNIEKLNKLIDGTDEQLLMDIKNTKSNYFEMISGIETLLSSRIDIDAEQSQTLISDLSKRKKRKSVAVTKSSELVKEIKEILEKYGVPESLVQRDVENLSEQSKMAFIGEDDKHQMETRAKKELLEDITTSHSGKTRVKHSLSKLRKALDLLGHADTENLKLQLDKLLDQKEELLAQLNQLEQVIENKNASLRGRYTREHIEDENYSTPFMAKLKTAIDELTCKKKEIENQIDALDSQIKQLQDLISSVDSDFKI